VGEKGDGDQALGKSKGGFSTKLNLRGEGFGKPITWVLTGGQRLEATQVQALMEGGAARRPSGQIRVRPAWVAGDKGYTGRKIRRYLRRGIGTVTPRLRNEPRRGVRFDRLINRLKQFRAVATRYDKLAVRFHATVNLAAIRLWL
jgi:transposase